MPLICPISVMASPKTASLGTFSLGGALVWAFFLGLALPISPRGYGTITYNLQFNSLLPVLSCCGPPFTWSFWKDLCNANLSLQLFIFHLEISSSSRSWKQKYCHGAVLEALLPLSPGPQVT